MSLNPDDISSIRKAWNDSWNLNVSGTYVMTHVFIPLLLKSSDARLLFITSGTASLAGTEDKTSPMGQRLNASPPAGWPKSEGNRMATYRSAKTGMNMMVRDWYRCLGNDNIKVFNISPGFLATGLAGKDQAARDWMKNAGARDPALGGKFVKDVVEGARDGDEGKVVGWMVSPIQPW